MSRHRIVRSMNYEDEYYDDEDEYSRSVEDNYCISPGTAAQFTWSRDREKNLDFATYMGGAPVIDEEGEEDEDEEVSSTHGSLSESASGTRLALSDTEQALLNSCLEEIRNIIGETVSESVMTEVIVQNKFDVEASLNQLLSLQDKPKPQREPRQRRNHSQDDPKAFESVGTNSGTSNLKNVRVENEMGDLRSGVQLISLANEDKSKRIGNTNIKVKSQGPKNQQLSEALDNKEVEKQASGQIVTQSTLSNLARVHAQSTGSREPNSKDIGMSLANLAKQHGSTVGQRPVVLSVRSDEKPSVEDGMAKLSSLVAQHSARNGMAKGIQHHEMKISRPSDIKEVSKDPPSSQGSPKDVSLLSGLIKKHKEDNPSSFGSLQTGLSKPASSGFNLSDLAKKHQDSNPSLLGRSANSKAGPSSSPGLSLSDLAKQHRVQSTPSLSQLAKQHHSSPNPASPSNVSVAALTKEHKGGSKSSETLQAHSSISSPRAGREVACPTHSGERSELGITGGVEKFSISEREGSVRNCNKPENGVPAALSLASCLKTNQVNKKLSQPVASVSGHCEQSLENSASDTKDLLLVESASSSDHFQIFQHVDLSLVTKASGLGIALCGVKRKRKVLTECCANDSVYGSFASSWQLKTRKLYKEHRLHQLTAFQFATPSPDDIIERRQNRAFTRPEKEFTV